MRSDWVKTMKDYRVQLCNQTGATSIFVMIFMVVLIVFGLAALTTSLAGLKLADKNHTWSKEYYLLEAEAEKEIALIDALLCEAEISARDYITLGEYLKTSGTILADEDQKRVNDAWLMQDKAFEKGRFLEQVVQYIYYNAASKLALDYVEAENNVSYDKWKQGVNEELVVDFTVKEEKISYPKNLQISLKVMIPLYDLLITEDGKVTGTRSTEFVKRYQVMKWREWQTPFEYTDDINFENPEFEDPGFEEPFELSEDGREQESESQEGIFIEEK